MRVGVGLSGGNEVSIKRRKHSIARFRNQIKSFVRVSSTVTRTRGTEASTTEVVNLARALIGLDPRFEEHAA